MHLFYNRPLACACMLFVAMMYVVSLFDGTYHVWYLPIIVFLIGGLITIITKHKLRMAVGTIFITLGILGGLLQGTSFFMEKLPFYQSYVGETVNLEGRVIRRLTSAPYSTTFLVEVERIDEEEINGDIKLECTYASALQPGERFTLTAIGREFEQTDGYDEWSSSVADGMLVAFVCSDVKSCELLPDNGVFSWRVWFSKRNDDLSFRLRQNVDGREGNLLAALLLGNRDMLDPETAAAFERTGVSHLLALSGSHFSILMGIFDWILRKFFRCPKAPRLIFLIALSTGYLFLTGCTPSAMRAVLMFCGLAFGFYCKTEHDPFTSLCLSLFVLVLISPHAIFDLGMWMSYITTAVIVIFLPITEDWRDAIYDHWKLPIWMYVLTVTVMTALFIGIIANIAMTVVLALAFLKLPLLSVIHTLILTIPISIALFMGMLGVLSPIFALPCRLIAGFIITITENAADLPYILIPMNHPASQLLALLLAVSIVFIVVAKLRDLRWGLLPVGLSILLVFTSLVSTYMPTSEAKVDYIRVGNGEVLIFSSSGKAAVFDFTDGTATAAHDIADTLLDAGCTELEDLVLSHYHNKDAYFISRLANELKVRNLHLPLPLDKTESAIAQKLENEAIAYGIAVDYTLTNIGLSNLENCSLERAAMPGGRHIALLFSVTLEGTSFVYLNSSVPDSALSQKAEWLFYESDIVIVGKTGLSGQSSTPLPYLRHQVKTLLLSHEDIRRLVHYAIIPKEYPIAPETYSWDLLIESK